MIFHLAEVSIKRWHAILAEVFGVGREKVTSSTGRKPTILESAQRPINAAKSRRSNISPEADTRSSIRVTIANMDRQALAPAKNQVVIAQRRVLDI
jgi:hypothetical protein